MALRPRGAFALGVFAGLLLAAGIVVVGSRVGFEQGWYEPCRVGQVWTVEKGCVNAVPYGPGWLDVHTEGEPGHDGQGGVHAGEAPESMEPPGENPGEAPAEGPRK
jgi:hypothetical protein